MKANTGKLAVAMLVAGALGLVLRVSAGDLNPPAGAISSTMRTLNEVYSAVGQSSSTACGPCVPAADRMASIVSAPGYIDEPTEVFAVSASVLVPLDPSTGQPSGVRQHGPMRMTKKVDKSTPTLQQGCAGGDTIPEVTITMHNPSGAYFEYKLTGARVVGVATTKQLAAGAYADLEEVSFIFTRIKYTSFEGAAGPIEFEDDLSGP